MSAASSRFKKRRSKLAVSAVIGSIMMIGVTLVVGFGAWAWASAAARNSELNFGNSVTCNANYLKESFSIINVNYSSPSSVTVWFYNTGNSTVYIKEILASNITGTWIDPITSTNNQVTACNNANQKVYYYVQLPAGVVTPVTFQVSATLASGVIYQFEAVGLYGTTYTYQQTR